MRAILPPALLSIRHLVDAKNHHAAFFRGYFTILIIKLGFSAFFNITQLAPWLGLRLAYKLSCVWCHHVKTLLRSFGRIEAPVRGFPAA